MISFQLLATTEDQTNIRNVYQSSVQAPEGETYISKPFVLIIVTLFQYFIFYRKYSSSYIVGMQMDAFSKKYLIISGNAIVTT